MVRRILTKLGAVVERVADERAEFRAGVPIARIVFMRSAFAWYATPGVKDLRSQLPKERGQATLPDLEKTKVVVSP